MKINIKFLLPVLAVSLALVSSCTRDEVMVNPPPPSVETGVYILSEGAFAPGTSKLSFYNSANDSFYQSIFSPGALGLFPNGMVKVDNNLFVTEQGNFGAAGKIYKLDLSGNVLSSASIGTNPFAISETNGRLFVTNGPSNKVLVINRESLLSLGEITVRNYPQELTGIGNRVFVCNTGSFTTGDDSVITVIDAGNNQIVGNVVVGKNPSSVAASSDGKLLVGCPGDSLTAAIYKIDPINLSTIAVYRGLKYGFSKDLNISGSSKLYFVAGNVYDDREVVSYDIGSGSSQIIIGKPSGYLNYGLIFDSGSGRLYVCNAAADFTSPGRFRAYSSSGALLKDILMDGVSPRRMLIKR